MKLNILLLACMCLEIAIQASTLASRQLFDVVHKEFDKSKPKSNNSAPRSLFGRHEARPQNYKHNQNKNIFDSINFNQIKEKELETERIEKEKSNVSLFSNVESQSQIQNRNQNQEQTKVEVKDMSEAEVDLEEKSQEKNESESKTEEKTGNENENSLVKVGVSSSEGKAESQETSENVSSATSSSASAAEMRLQKNSAKNKKEIKILKKKVNVLLQMNEKLMKRVKSDATSHKNKKNKFKKNFVSFIQKHDNDVSSLRQHIESSKSSVESEINKKDQEFKKLYDQTNNSFSQLQMQIQNVTSKVSELQSEEVKKLNQLHSNFSLKDLKVLDKLNVDGIAFFNKLNAISIDLGNIKLDAEQISFLNENSKIVVGKEVATVGDIMKGMKIFKSLIAKCGENFEKCKPASDEIIKEQVTKQEQILENLKLLRNETSQVFAKKKKRLR